MQESRYLIHVYAISAVFAVLGWRFVASLTANRGRLLSAAVVALSLAYGLFMILAPQRHGLPALFSASAAEQRRIRSILWVESFDFINHDPLVTRVLILDRSVLSYYSEDYIKPFGQWGELVYPDSPTEADILRKVDELHISHVLDVQSAVSDFRVPANYPGLLLIFERPGQRIYKVVPKV
jgi:hypothetical protein